MAYKLYIEDNVSPPAVVWTDVAPTGDYTDYTNDIGVWDEHGEMAVNSNTVRDNIKSLVIAIAGSDFSTWSSVNPADKKIAARWKVAPLSLRLGEITTAEDKEQWAEVMEKVEVSRSLIYLKMRLVVSEYLRDETITKTDSENFFTAVQLLSERFVYANDPCLYEWLNNTVGSPYENAGFAEETYYSVQFRDDINSKYNGEF